MSTKHLAAGSIEPPRKDGVIRVYSTKFCPFARRVLLVLKAKNLNFDIVNVDLKNKPDWFIELNPNGKVPFLIDGSTTMPESLDISYYLDEKYPQNSLWSVDDATKKRDKELIEQASSIFKSLFEIFRKDECKNPGEWAKFYVDALQIYEDELEKRGTTFFGGEKPGMCDYMIWPWVERTDVVEIKLGSKLPLGDNLLLIRKWTEAMKKDPVVLEYALDPNKYWILMQRMANGEPPRYDEI